MSRVSVSISIDFFIRRPTRGGERFGRDQTGFAIECRFP